MPQPETPCAELPASRPEEGALSHSAVVAAALADLSACSLLLKTPGPGSWPQG